MCQTMIMLDLLKNSQDKIFRKAILCWQMEKVIGEHQGIIRYTIGQRKGLNLSIGHPVFVTEIGPDTNEVVIGENEDLFVNTLICDRVNFMAIEGLEGEVRLKAKIRYNHTGADCVIFLR